MAHADTYPSNGLRPVLAIYLALLACAYAALVMWSGITFETYRALWIIFPVGILGAIIANGTGTGGGVVFLPVFSGIAAAAVAAPEMFSPELRDRVQIDTLQIVGISFLIQCFGMSMGAVNWLRAVSTPGKVPWDERMTGRDLQILTFAPIASGLPALLITQRMIVVESGDLLTYFKVFSIALGTILLFFAWQQRGKSKLSRRLSPTTGDIWVLLALGAVGGAVTALFSVGIGEFVAVYLILRGFPTTMAIAVAVWVSVVCVLSGVWFHVSAGTIVYELALVAIPGAILGGYLSRSIAAGLGPLWLKTLAALWIIASSVYLILIV